MHTAAHLRYNRRSVPLPDLNASDKSNQMMVSSALLLMK